MAIENIMQVFAQETIVSDVKRIVVQIGTSTIPDDTQFFNYDELSTADKATYDAFMLMVTNLG